MLENNARQPTQTKNKACSSVLRRPLACSNVNYSESSVAHEIQILYREIFHIVTIGFHLKYQNPSLGKFLANNLPASNGLLRKKINFAFL